MLARIELLRTFSRLRGSTEDDDDWSRYFDSARGALKWSDLHEQRVTVVVGEAGIGKTTEFKYEHERLERLGKATFFIELSVLAEGGSWQLALGQASSAFDTWRQSTEEGFFFLDAVDEARLTSHAALKRTLLLAHSSLNQYFSRVRVAISSRVTDWSIADVQASVKDLLVVPIARACQSGRKLDLTNGSPQHTKGIRFPESSSEESPEPFVVKLSPLSIIEAQKLVDAWEVSDGKGFWSAIEEGEYEDLATRPLDLGWMAQVWNGKRSLGTYRELIEGGTANRLTEVNPSYCAAGVVLSLQQLREGAELLAVATELSGRTHILCEPSPPGQQGELVPLDILGEWSSIDAARLLASALFDEATFGRVKFHHRATRAYLAACWIDRQLRAGMPLHRVLSLFVACPFGEAVLIPARRWALCWLAAINAAAREWVVHHFPELLLFDGDPEAWDVMSADTAFGSYVQLCKGDYRPDWYNNSSEFRRVGKRLTPGLVAHHLADPQLPTNVKVSLLPIVVHARLTDCANVVYGLYKSYSASEREKLRALEALAVIATFEHRAAIKAELTSGAFNSNDFIAAALRIVYADSLTSADLTHIFEMTGAEEEYGQGSMATIIVRELLRTATISSASSLLVAVVASLPAQNEAEQFNKYHGPKPERAWVLDVLPACLEQLLCKLDAAGDQYPAGLPEAAMRIEEFRHAWYSDQDLESLHKQIACRPHLRWSLASMFGRSPSISHLPVRMCWSGCLVRFGAEDLSALTLRANDVQLSPTERDFWFQIASEVAMGYFSKHVRNSALAALTVVSDREARTQRIAIARKNAADALVHRRRWALEQRQRDEQRAEELRKSAEQIRGNLVHVRDASHKGTLGWLVQFAYGNAGRIDTFGVNYNVISDAFGADIAEALAEGLIAAWETIEPPNPADYPNGSIPWEVILGLAGLYSAVEKGQDLRALGPTDVARNARWATWELKRPPEWFNELTASNEPAVLAALRPWIEADVRRGDAPPQTRRALELALRCQGTVRTGLLVPLVPVVMDRQIPSDEVFKELFNALCEIGQFPPGAVGDLCRKMLTEDKAPDGLIGDIHWLRVWLEKDVSCAWSWFVENISAADAIAKAQVKQFAEQLSDFNWLHVPLNDSTVGILMQLHSLVLKHRSPEDVESDNRDAHALTMTRVLETVPAVLVRTPGRVAHQALRQLRLSETDPAMRTWLRLQVQEHAAMQATEDAHFEPNQLKTLASPLVTEPRNERQLFEQVIARLEELRVGIEEGPFSDRGMFSVGMPEKLLQLWLAARFRDTPNRQFSVHREEEVDDDKAPDIQLSARSWNVCVEIKPVDTQRSYSATSLTGTISSQLVGQYLKGFNSTHGILVLLRLDHKRWDIPGLGTGKDFKELVNYLQGQARSIKEQHPRVQELVVFGIDCSNTEVSLPSIKPQTSVLSSGAAVDDMAHAMSPGAVGPSTEMRNVVATTGRKAGSRGKRAARKHVADKDSDASSEAKILDE